jgi:peptide subunit release factor 1 (eRF1)
MQISRVAKMLADEFGTASNIKNRVNRQARRRRDQRAYGLC